MWLDRNSLGKLRPFVCANVDATRVAKEAILNAFQSAGLTPALPLPTASPPRSLHRSNHPLHSPTNLSRPLS